jgi:uncharacterized membrane protein (DUF2068 family)
MEKGKMRKDADKRIVELIGVLKLIKGLLLFAAATGVFALLGSDLETLLTSLVHHLHVDPGNRYFQTFLTHVLGLSPKLPLIITGFYIYAAIFFVEGIGLLMRKHWAEYFTVIVTGSFLPLEIYEFLRNENIPKALVIVINLAILIYLARRLWLEHPQRPAFAS